MLDFVDHEADTVNCHYNNVVPIQADVLLLTYLESGSQVSAIRKAY